MKAIQERQSTTQQLNKVQQQVDATAGQNNKLTIEIAEKTRRLEIGEQQSREMALEIDSLMVQVSQMDVLRQAHKKLESETT
jgi:hypothetical protein